MASVFCLLSFFFLFLFCFYCYDLINFKFVFLSLYSDNLIVLEFRDVWEKDYCVCSFERREKQGICVKVVWQHFSLQLFLPIGEDKKYGPGREKFLPSFLSSQFSFSNQTVKNSVFHPIFLPLFSILPIFTQTKHNLKQNRRERERERREKGENEERGF